MRAIILTKTGAAEQAFEIKEIPKPEPSKDEVLVKVDAFGFNYADITARWGKYKDAPLIPSILGYEIVGKIEETGNPHSAFKKGQLVLAFTRFGGYAEYAVSNELATVAIPENTINGEALALATQYCTAYYAAHEQINLHENDKILIQAAAGGVGSALVQLCKLKGCKIYGTAGSDKKMEFIRKNGVDYPINYTKEDFSEIIKEKLDVVFESVGGKTFSKSFKLLDHGGRIVAFGASGRSIKSKTILPTLKLVWDYGFYNPAFLIMGSRSIIGVNMLRIADVKTQMLSYCLHSVVDLYAHGKIKPHVDAVFKAEETWKAHQYIEQRKSMGKVIAEW